MASLTSPGIGSGLDVSGIVAQLVAAERAPAQTRFDVKEAQALSKLSALGSIRSALASFQSALEPLKALETFQGRTTASENDEIFTATADSTAVPGRYAIEVTALATASKIRSAAFATADTVVGNGTLTLRSGSEIFTVDIAAPEDTLAGIAAAINDATGNTQILATIVNSVDGASLVLSSASTGLDSAITVQTSGGDGGLDALIYDPLGGTTNMTEVTAAADASLTIDGLLVSADGNVVSEAIQGVDINLESAEPGTTYQLSVGYDVSGARDQLQAFVGAYNGLLQAVGSQASFNAETFEAGPLFGESAIRGLTGQIRSTIGGFVEGTPSSFRALVEIGITTTLDGTLSIDETVLSSAFADDFDDVGRLFSDEAGFATRLDDLVSTFLEPTSALATRTDGLETLIDDISDSREALDRRMISVEARLTAQFSALDSLISQLDSTSAFLGQQLGNLPGFTNPNNR